MFASKLSRNIVRSKFAQSRCQGNRVYIGNIPWGATVDEITDHFSQCGNVINVRIPTNRETGQTRGFAFVTFDTDAGAQKAVETMNGADLMGRSSRVSFATPPPPRQFNNE